MLCPDIEPSNQVVSKDIIGLVSFINHDMQNKRRILKSMASNNPMVLALGCSFAGSLDDMIDKKTILSIPNTISRKARVRRAIQALGKRKVSRISICFW